MLFVLSVFYAIDAREISFITRKVNAVKQLIVIADTFVRNFIKFYDCKRVEIGLKERS